MKMYLWVAIGSALGALAFRDHLRMRLMVLGPDASFGRGAPKDTPERMRALGRDAGFEVVQIEPLMHDHERYSSTAVRSALCAVTYSAASPSQTVRASAESPASRARRSSAADA